MVLHLCVSRKGLRCCVARMCPRRQLCPGRECPSSHLPTYASLYVVERGDSWLRYLLYDSRPARVRNQVVVWDGQVLGLVIPDTSMGGRFI